MKILFIGNSRLGDAILSTSILDYFNKKEDSDITVVCSPLSEDVYKSFCNVKKLIIVNKKKKGMHWIDVYASLDRQVWDLVVDLRNTIISRIVRKKRVFRYNNNNSHEHRVESLCKLIKIKKKLAPRIPHDEQTEEKANLLKKKYKLKSPIIAIAPVTNWKRKNWPVDNFALLINKLVEDSPKSKIDIRTVIILGSENEKNECELLRKKIRTINAINLSGKVEIKILHALLKKCLLFIGNDSGLMHLAAAAEINTLGLFGPSKETNYRPWGKKSYFIRTKENYDELVLTKDYNRFENTSLMESLKVTKVYKKCLMILK